MSLSSPLLAPPLTLSSPHTHALPTSAVLLLYVVGLPFGLDFCSLKVKGQTKGPDPENISFKSRLYHNVKLKASLDLFLAAFRWNYENLFEKKLLVAFSDFREIKFRFLTAHKQFFFHRWHFTAHQFRGNRSACFALSIAEANATCSFRFDYR